MTLNSAQNTVCGGIMRDRYMKGLQPLAACIERITKQSEKGFLVGLDGRKLKVRSTHSALNLKLQSTGAILMKATLVKCMEALQKEGLVIIGKGYVPNKYVELFTFYHDEFQIGMGTELVTDTKVIELDLSQYDLTIKSEKKEAAKRLESAGARFKSRQRKTVNKCWSNPKIDLDAGTATLLHSPLGDICVDVFEQVGRDFDLSCPVTGEYDIGQNWYETH